MKGSNVIRTEQRHASAVTLEGRGLLILGPSGSGKSTLALQLMAAGCVLVSDDRTDLQRDGNKVYAAAPAPLSGRIEARGLGILHAETVAPVALSLVVELGQGEDMRLPPARYAKLLGIRLPLALGPYQPHLYAALRQYLVSGRAD